MARSLSPLIIHADITPISPVTNHVGWPLPHTPWLLHNANISLYKHIPDREG